MAGRGRPAKSKAPRHVHLKIAKTKPGKGNGKRKPKEQSTLQVDVESVIAVCSWSCCKKCNKSFIPNELRLAYREVNEQGNPLGSRYWVHLHCINSIKTAPWRAKLADVPLEQINGFDALSADNQALLGTLFSNMARTSQAKTPLAKTSSDHMPVDETQVANNHIAETTEIELERSPNLPSSTSKCPAASQVIVDGEVRAEAKQLKLLKKLDTLAARPDIVSLSVSALHLLDALKAANGGVVQAKKALLGA